MTRREELSKLFSELDGNIQTIVSPMLEDLVFIEEQLEELRKQPFIKYHPKDPTIQKATPASKLYKDLLAQEKDIVRILCSQVHKGSSEDGESPLRAFLKTLERR